MGGGCCDPEFWQGRADFVLTSCIHSAFIGIALVIFSVIFIHLINILGYIFDTRLICEHFEMFLCHFVQVLSSSVTEEVDDVKDHTFSEELWIWIHSVTVWEVLCYQLHIWISDHCLGDCDSFALLFHFNFDTIKHLICLHKSRVWDNVYPSCFLDVSVDSCSHTFERIQLVNVSIWFSQITVEVEQCLRQISICDFTFFWVVFLLEIGIKALYLAHSSSLSTFWMSFSQNSLLFLIICACKSWFLWSKHLICPIHF